MLIDHNCASGDLVVGLSGEIDHHNASRVVSAVDDLLDSCEVSSLILDFSKVTFMDSSGVGLVLGRYNIARRRGIKLSLRNVPGFARRIFILSGVDKLIDIG